MHIEEEHVAANLEDFLYSLEVWLKLHNLSLSDFYEWEDKCNEDLHKMWRN